MGDFTDAIDCARTASQLLRQHHGGWYLLANLYRDTGKPVQYIWAMMKAKYLQNFGLESLRSLSLPRNLNYAPGVR